MESLFKYEESIARCGIAAVRGDGELKTLNGFHGIRPNPVPHVAVSCPGCMPTTKKKRIIRITVLHAPLQLKHVNLFLLRLGSEDGAGVAGHEERVHRQAAKEHDFLALLKSIVAGEDLSRNGSFDG